MKILDDNRNALIAAYASGTSVQALARLYQCNDWTVKNFLLKNKIKTRTRADNKIKFNDQFLLNLTPESAYFWGFMLGDGSLIQRKEGYRFLTVTLKNTDLSILHQFCDWLQMDYKHIKTGINNHGTHYVRLNLNGQTFYQDLSKFGFVPRKTYNPVVPQIELEFIKPFILGLIDADGSVAWQKPRTNNKFPHRRVTYEYSISIIGHPLIMDWVENQLYILGFVGNINSQIVKNKWKRLRIQKKDDVLSLARLLQVNNFSQFLLQRKWKSLIEELQLGE